MRQRTINRETRDSKRETAKLEPMVEGPAGKHGKKTFYYRILPYLQLRQEMIVQGLNDLKISKRIASENGWKEGTVYITMKQLVQNKAFPPNPNKRNVTRLSREEKAKIREKRNMLILHGLPDEKIAEMIAGDIGRGKGAIYHYIRRWIHKSEIDINPNSPTSYSEEELKTIKEVQGELIKKGFLNFQIAKALSYKLGRSTNTIHFKLKKMEKDGEIPINPRNRSRKKYSDSEHLFIKRLMEKLVSEGKRDFEIVGFIAKKTGRPELGIMSYLKKLRDSGKFQTNPNSIRLTKKEIELIKRMRISLFPKLHNDTVISKIIEKKTGIKADRVRRAISRLIHKGEILPSLRLFSEKEDALIKSIRSEQMILGYRDYEIAGKLAARINRSQDSIDQRIRKLCSLEEIPPNPNKVRDWETLTPEQHIRYALDFMKETGISTRSGLYRKDRALNESLRKRKLLERVFAGFARMHRQWILLSNDEIISLAHSLIQEKMITERKGLQKIDNRLYQALSKRGLITLVFADIEKSMDKSLDQQLLSSLAQAPEAMERFGQNDK